MAVVVVRDCVPVTLTPQADTALIQAATSSTGGGGGCFLMAAAVFRSR